VKFKSTDLQARGEAPLFRRAIILATSPSLRCEGGMGGESKLAWSAGNKQRGLAGYQGWDLHFAALRSCLLTETTSESI
jgi:hypothetical protein